MKCKNCNKINDKDANYCTECGKKLKYINNKKILNSICLTVIIFIIGIISLSIINNMYSNDKNMLNASKVIGFIEEEKLSNDWTDDELIIDGTKYSLQDKYNKYVTNGWTVDLKKYGLTNYILNSKDKTPSTLSLKNKKYKDSDLYIGLTNLDDNEKEITDCEVWAISIYNSYTTTPVSFELPGGIKYGSTKEEIERIYGQLPESSITKSKDSKYVVYHYKNNSQYLDLTIYNDKGLLDLDYRHY